MPAVNVVFVRLYFKIVDPQVSKPQFNIILVSSDDDTDHFRRKSSGPACKKLLVALLETKDRHRVETEDTKRFE